MTNLKDETISRIIDVEGGYVDDPSDSGGETNYGITLSVARANGYSGSMRDLPKSKAYEIYSKKYWDSVKGDQLVSLSNDIAAEVVDTAVNAGVYRASEFLQRLLNVMNKNQKLYNDLVVDGNIGPATISALAVYLEARDENVFLDGLNCLQGAFYIELAERRQKDEKFIYGWLKNRVSL